MKWIKWIVILVLILQFYEAKELNATNDLIIQKEKQFCDSEIKDKEANIKELKEKCLDVAINYEAKKNYDSASWFYLLGGQYERDITFLKDKITKNYAKANLAHAFVLAGNFDEAKKLYSDFLSNTEPFWADNAMQEDYKALFKIYPQKKENLQKALTMWSKLYKPYLPYKKAYSKYKEAKKNQNYQAAAIYLEEAIKLLEKLRKKSFAIYQNYFDLGIAYYDATNYKKALKYFKKALSGYEKKDDIEILKSLANLYGWIGDSYFKMQKCQKALDFYKKQAALYENKLKGYNKKYANSLYDIANCYNLLKKYDKSFIIAEKAAEICEKSNIKNFTLSNSYWLMANDAFNLKDYAQAITYYKKSIEVAKKLKGYTPINYANNLFDLMESYYYNFESKKALQTALKAEKIFKQNNDLLDLSYIENWIGTIYYDSIFIKTLDKYKKAAIYFKKSKNYMLLYLLQQANMKQDYISNQISLSNAYYKSFDVKKALKEAKKSLWLLQENNQTKELSNIYSIIIDIDEFLNYYHLGLDYLNKKIALDKKLYGLQSLQVAKDNANKARFFAFLDDYDKAKFFIQKALAILQFVKDKESNYKKWKKWEKNYEDELKANEYDKKAINFRAKKDFKKAIKYFKLAYYLRANIYKNDYDVDVLKSYINLGDTYLAMKNYKKALKFYTRAFHLSKSATLMRLHPELQTFNLAKKIIKVYKVMGDFKKALYYSQILNNYLLNGLKEYWQMEYQEIKE